MANEKKSNLSEEYLRKFRHRAGYVINESPKYRPLVTDSEEFDEIPVLTNEVGEQQPPIKPKGEVPPAPSNDVPQGAETPASPIPASDADIGGVPPEGEMADPMGDPMAGGMPEPDPMADPMVNPMGAPEPENQVNDLQNEIIKHNIEAMRGIHDQLEGLNATIMGLNQKMDVLGAEVEEVREPTDAEKLMNKTSVSYPYYFNLNDLWSDNWFDQKRVGAAGQDDDRGMKELPDGTYVADFDDLPQKSKIDIQDSFNDFV